MEMKIFMLQLQISAAVIVILLLRAGMKRLPKIYSYGLWMLVFLRLLIPVQLESVLGLMPSLEDGGAWMMQMAEGDSQGNADVNGGNGTAAEPVNVGYNTTGENVPGGADKYLADAGAYADGTGNDITDPSEAGLAAMFSLSAPLRRMFLLLWAAGVLGILTFNGISLVKIRRRLQGSEHLSGNVYVSANISTPFVLGLFGARIYLPAGLKETEREYILCHERTHIKRRDYLVKNLAFLLTALYWFNPFVWLAFYFLERDMEMSCDEKVLKLMGDEIKRQYSQSLLDFAKGRSILAVTPFALGENGVKQRVKNVLAYHKTKKWSIVAGVMVIAAAMVILFTVRAGATEADGDTNLHQDTQPSENIPLDNGSQEIVPAGSDTTLPADDVEDTVAGHVVWNGKTAAELTEVEADEYGVWVRRQLLANPGTLMLLADGTPEETLALADLDGDGRAERIFLRAELRNYGETADWELELNGNVLTGYAWQLCFDIWAVSLDGEDILLALYEDGPSNDPLTTLFHLKGGELQLLGSFPGDIRIASFEDGVIGALAQMDEMATDVLYRSWRVTEDGQIEELPIEHVFQDIYGIDPGRELLVELPICEFPGGETVGTITPQPVTLVTDNGKGWVYVVASGGRGGWGWFRMEGSVVTELDKEFDQVFQDMNTGE